MKEKPDRARCVGTRRDGSPCEALSVRGRDRCRSHAGPSTGPKTPEGRERALANLRQYRKTDSVASDTPKNRSHVVEVAGDSAHRSRPVTAKPTDKGTTEMTEGTPSDTHTLAEIEQRHATLEAEHAAAEEALDEAKAAFGEAALGTDPDKTTQAGERVAELQRDVLRLQAALDALDRHRGAARERDAAAAQAAKWDAFAAALKRRDELFEKAERVVKPFFDAVDAAIDAGAECDRLCPVSKILTPDGWELMPNIMDGMKNMKDEELTVVRKALANLTDKSRAASEAALRMREFDKAGAVREFTDARGPVVVQPDPVLDASHDSETPEVFRRPGRFVTANDHIKSTR